MTGPQHYRQAEADLGSAERSGDYGSEQEAFYLRRAQVHATLALAAATAVSSNSEMPVPDSDAWISVASAYKPPVKLNDGAS